MHDNDDPSIRQKLVCKKHMDSVKLSTDMFQKGMKENSSKMCGIEKMDGTSIETRSTLFQKTREKHKHLQEGL
jgi:hypothetical protein